MSEILDVGLSENLNNVKSHSIFSGMIPKLVQVHGQTKDEHWTAKQAKKQKESDTNK